MEEDLRIFEVGVHSVRLAAALEESLEHERVEQGEHERVGGRDSEQGATGGQGDHYSRSQHEE